MIGLGRPTMSWKSYLLVSGVGVMATYFVSTPVAPLESRPVSRRVEAAQVQAANDIQQLSLQLQQRVRAEVTFREPSRNPFRFSARPAPVSPMAELSAAAPAAVAMAAPPALPLLSLIGIAADEVDGGTQRTAIISTGQAVLLVRDGDAVGADYKVSKVEDGAVELKSTADGSVRRLAFKP